MNRLGIVSAAFIAGLMLSGCNSAPQTGTPAKPTVAPVVPVTAPILPGTEAQRIAEHEKFVRAVEAEKRKHHGSAYVIKNKAYTNYIP